MENSKSIVLSSRAGSVATLTMNRPEARNSLSLKMLERLTQEITDCGSVKKVHVIVLAANGSAFCAGHDLKELTTAREQPDQGRAFFERTMTACSRLMLAIINCPKPVIASVQGVATAAGCQLVASCDLALAATDVYFATPGVNIGLFCSTPMVALSRNISNKKSMEMLLCGELVPAADAEAYGLINKSVAPEQLVSETLALATKIADKAPATLRIGKEAFYTQKELSLEGAYKYTSDVMVMNMMAPDAEEGIGAFLEKRSPKWTSL